MGFLMLQDWLHMGITSRTSCSLPGTRTYPGLEALGLGPHPMADLLVADAEPSLEVVNFPVSWFPGGKGP